MHWMEQIGDQEWERTVVAVRGEILSGIDNKHNCYHE